ncbi:MAG: nicotinate-nucleotide diphosphorylase (carboxylating), partial [Actinomycetota bacterium]
SEALEAGATQVLLDNMAPDEVHACVELAAGRAVVEASGGIGLDNIRDYAEAGADIISVGAITRDATGIDFSLEVEP